MNGDNHSLKVGNIIKTSLDVPTVCMNGNFPLVRTMSVAYTPTGAWNQPFLHRCSFDIGLQLIRDGGKKKLQGNLL